MKTKKEQDKVWSERSGAVKHAVRSFTLQLFSPLHAFLGSSGLHTLDTDKPLDWNAARQPQYTAPALLLVFALVSHEVVQQRHTERSAVERSRLIDLDDEGSAVRPPAISTDSGLYLEDHRILAHRAEAPQLASYIALSLK